MSRKRKQTPSRAFICFLGLLGALGFIDYLQTKSIYLVLGGIVAGLVALIVKVARQDVTPVSPKIIEFESKPRPRVKVNKTELLDVLKKLDPYDFERYIAKLYKELGYKVEQTSRTNDGGKDIILKKDGIVYFVECKRYTDKTVGRPELQKLIGACSPVGAKPIFVTTSRYNQNALKYARESGVQLIDGAGILRMAERLEKERA